MWLRLEGQRLCMNSLFFITLPLTVPRDGLNSLTSASRAEGGWMPQEGAAAMNMFDKCHIPPSHRRLAHQSWTTSVCLLLDLLMEQGSCAVYALERRVRVEARVLCRLFQWTLCTTSPVAYASCPWQWNAWWHCGLSCCCTRNLAIGGFTFSPGHLGTNVFSFGLAWFWVGFCLFVLGLVFCWVNHGTLVFCNYCISS